MADRSDDPRNSRGFRLRLVRARAALAFERAWPALWPSVGILGLFVAISLFGLWQLLPGWLHLLGLLAFAAALGWSLWRCRDVLVWPEREHGLARLERASGLRHQPLRAIGDEEAQSGRDATAVTLWRVHQERLRRSLARLRVGRPRSDLPRRDPWALRAGLALVLVVAVVDAGGQAGQRLLGAFTPGLHGGPSGPPPELALWITPPDYTKRPPLLVAAQEREPGGAAPAAVSVPQGSRALVQVHHARAASGELLLELGAAATPLTRVGEASAEARVTIEASGRLAVEQGGRELGAWNIEVVPDRAPEVRFAEDPGQTHRGVLRTVFLATDDYGVTEVTLRMSRPGEEDEAERMRLLRLAEAPQRIEDSAYLDLTPHPYAGLPVTLQLEARDAAGQTGLSEPLEVVLPERVFNHPLARAIIEQRKRLVDEPRRRQEVAAMLSGLAQTRLAEESGVGVQLGLRVSSSRLFLYRTESAHAEVVDLLWEIALYLEDGSLSVAERNLREIQRELQQALAEGAPDEELERLMAELERALEAWLDALAEDALSRMDPDTVEPMRLPEGAMTMDRSDFQEMMDRLRDMMQTGARDAAREMLSQLQQMLESMTTEMSPMMQQSGEAFSQLEDLIRRQQELLERSFQMQREMAQRDRRRPGEMPGDGDPQQEMPGQDGMDGDPMGGAAMDQDALRRALGELMEALGEMGMRIPRAFGEAELSMRDARDSLGEGEPGQASESQGRAIDQLQQGGQAMLEQLEEQFGPGMAGQPGQPMMPDGRGRDPLGRSTHNNGGADLFGDYVPDELDLGRARQILEELYRRSSQQDRPAEELDYLERLLRRF